jgi:predicted nucleic acid-binding protein
LTPIEITSALWRRRHAGELDAEDHRRTDESFAHVSRRWIEIEAFAPIRDTARDLISRHVLRAADALQLASAIVAAGRRPGTLPFVTLDRELATAARVEGFTVLPDPVA